jgi:hypothetical protein
MALSTAISTGVMPLKISATNAKSKAPSNNLKQQNQHTLSPAYNKADTP